MTIAVRTGTVITTRYEVRMAFGRWVVLDRFTGCAVAFGSDLLALRSRYPGALGAGSM